MAIVHRLPGQAQTGALDISAVGTKVANIAAVTLTATAPAVQTSTAPAAATATDTEPIVAAAGEATAADLTLTQALQIDFDALVVDADDLRTKLAAAVVDITDLRTKLAAAIVDNAATKAQIDLVLAALDEFNVSA